MSFNYVSRPTVSSRKIYPFPDAHPDVFVELRKVPDAEQMRIYDKHKYNPASKNPSMARFLKVVEDLRKAQLLSWGGFETDGKPLEPSEENKDSFLKLADSVRIELPENEVTEDEPTLSLWLYCSRDFNAQEEADRKN